MLSFDNSIKIFTVTPRNELPPIPYFIVTVNHEIRVDIFAERNISYDLRQGNDSQLPKVHTTTYGFETISFLGNRLWSTLPNITKQASTLPIFKSHIKYLEGRELQLQTSQNIYTTGWVPNMMFISFYFVFYICNKF